MMGFLLAALIALLLFLRQPLLVILLAATAFVHLVWGRGELDYIVEDMWIGIDKELILSIPLVACMLPTMIGVLMLPAGLRVVKVLLPVMRGAN